LNYIPVLSVHYNLEVFYNSYSELINIDDELKAIHKQKWNELTEELNHEL